MIRLVAILFFLSILLTIWSLFKFVGSFRFFIKTKVDGNNRNYINKQKAIP